MILPPPKRPSAASHPLTLAVIPTCTEVRDRYCDMTKPIQVWEDRIQKTVNEINHLVAEFLSGGNDQRSVFHLCDSEKEAEYCVGRFTEAGYEVKYRPTPHRDRLAVLVSWE